MERDYKRCSNPLTDRYAGRAMSYNFSPQKKHSTWRRLWLALAECEKNLGLEITDEQLDEMRAHLDDVDFEAAAAKEKELRHDVMSHIHVFGQLCPKAMPIIHLGATSCFVTDNSELIQMRDGMQILHGKLLKLISRLSDFVERYKDLPTLGFTHYQVAQLTTVGKRFCLYLQDFVMDCTRLEHEMENLPFRSVKGTTGTQASFMALFKGDFGKVRALEKAVAAKMGFSRIIDLSGQTYTRKVDYFVLTALSGIAQSAYKMAGDIRLLANLREMEEPFGKKQIGSSAMAYKRNPMRSERVCSLARYLMNLPVNAAFTEATQWFERTLDDSANRRIVISDAFLAADAILTVLLDITDGLQVWDQVIAKHVKAELPFMATENLLMAAVQHGGDRQALHEVIRTHSMEAARRIKAEGKDNELLDMLRSDPAFACIRDDFDRIVNPADFIGAAPLQVEAYLTNVVRPLLAEHAEELKNAESDSVNV